jgi:UDP-N-acetylmuramate-alanine ligase
MMGTMRPDYDEALEEVMTRTREGAAVAGVHGKTIR